MADIFTKVKRSESKADTPLQGAADYVPRAHDTGLGRGRIGKFFDMEKGCWLKVAGCRLRHAEFIGESGSIRLNSTLGCSSFPALGQDVRLCKLLVFN